MIGEVFNAINGYNCRNDVHIDYIIFSKLKRCGQ